MGNEKGDNRCQDEDQERISQGKDGEQLEFEEEEQGNCDEIE